VINAETSILKR